MTRAGKPVNPDIERSCNESDECITCGDVGVPMRVARLDRARGLARCEDAAGERTTVDVTLVSPVAVGDWVLVHAGTALQWLEAA